MNRRDITCTLAFCLALLLPACHAKEELARDRARPTVTLQSAPAASPAAPPEGAADIAGLVVRVKPSVVNITSTENVTLLREWPFGGLWPFAPEEDPDQQQFSRQSLGSGVIVDAQGYVVTNAHVVSNAQRVRVNLEDDRTFDATVIGRDERLDLAVLRLAGAKDLRSAVLGSSEGLRVGDYVVAIGNPFGLGNTVTMGIVSAKSREIGAGPYDDFIQTDASINPGNSGGPLFNLRGEVVGINTAIAAAGQGIGFAIPVDAAKDVLPQLIEKGQVSRGHLGVSVRPVDEPLAKQLGLDPPRGALVAELERGSPADRAGIQSGDIILKVEGVGVAHAHELARIVSRHQPGASIQVEVLRRGAPRTFEVVLDALKDRPKRLPTSPAPVPGR